MTDLSFLELFRLATIAAFICAVPAVSGAATLTEKGASAGRAIARPAGSGTDVRTLFVQGGCSAAAAQAAAQTGGQVLSVTTSQQGDQVVCIVTVLIPGQDGGRPRRQTVTIPQ